ncbi:serine/threonine protein kinase, partial [Myxococcota bacterium]|nr:serine/threonine protein kinase [Myxococcota bacterium]
MANFFKKYEIVEKIASGGMAEIYRACLHGAEGFQKMVAVKMIRPQLLAEPEFVEMFIKEATLAARLDHPNIVQVNEFDQEDGIYYIVMEYVRGVDVKSAFAQYSRPWDPSTVFFIAGRLLAALEHAHSLRDAYGNPLNIIHRDVTPHNILISVNGEVKLTDFGIAKVRDAVSYTKSNMVRGKLHYLSPEQARGEGGDTLDHRSDLFSLGLVLWELLTGTRRYVPREGFDIFPEIMEARFTPPSEVIETLDPRIDVLMEGFLNPVKTLRYENAREAIMAIKELFYADCTELLGSMVRQWRHEVGGSSDEDPTCRLEDLHSSEGQGESDRETVPINAFGHESTLEKDSIAAQLYLSTRQITELHRDVAMAREQALEYDQQTRPINPTRPPVEP